MSCWGWQQLSRTDCTSYLLLPFHVSFIHTCTHTCTHPHTQHARGCRTRLGRSCAGAVQGWGSLGCSSLASQRSLSLEGRMCSILYINPGGPSQLEALDPSGCSPHLWVFVWGWDLELSCRAAQASAMCLCGGGWVLAAASLPGLCREQAAYLDVHLWLGLVCGPSLLTCTTARPPPSVPPCWAAWWVGSCSAQWVPSSSVRPWGCLCCQPSPTLPSRPSCCLWTPYAQGGT